MSSSLWRLICQITRISNLLVKLLATCHFAGPLALPLPVLSCAIRTWFFQECLLALELSRFLASTNAFLMPVCKGDVFAHYQMTPIRPLAIWMGDSSVRSPDRQTNQVVENTTFILLTLNARCRYVSCEVRNYIPACLQESD